MVQADWRVRFYETETDFAIILDYQSDNIVISVDSDILAYALIFTLWRSISKDLYLVYKLTNVRRDLGLSFAQLTALAVVSSNDYNKNIYFRGSTTSYSMIKSL